MDFHREPVRAQTSGGILANSLIDNLVAKQQREVRSAEIDLPALKKKRRSESGKPISPSEISLFPIFAICLGLGFGIWV